MATGISRIRSEPENVLSCVVIVWRSLLTLFSFKARTRLGHWDSGYEYDVDQVSVDAVCDAAVDVENR